MSAYVEPLQRAISCLGHAKVNVVNRPRTVGAVAAWSLNAGNGIEVRQKTGPAIFEASQRFQLIEVPKDDDRREAGKYRVKTLEYAYNLIQEDGGTLSWHWHPKGNSPELRPHLHIPGDPRGHYPSPRFAIEDVIEWIITRGAVPACDDWDRRLMETGGPHKLYRSWVDPAPSE